MQFGAGDYFSPKIVSDARKAENFDARVGAPPSDFWLRNTLLYFALRADGFAVVQIRSRRI
jgi:hypothetical protein